MKNYFYTAGACLVFAISACKSSENSSSQKVEKSTKESNLQSIDVSYLDRSVRPQDDFFQFANGTWVQNNPVPASESRWGSFNELDRANKKKLTTILEEVKNTRAVNGSTQQILGHYYASMTNVAEREKRGIRPIMEDIHKIQSLKSLDNLPEVIGEMHKNGVSAAFSFGVGQDLKNVDYHITYLGQGGIGLPNKTYYFDEDKKTILNAYQGHIDMCFQVMGFSGKESAAAAKEIVKMETFLANSMMTPTELRSPEANYNKRSKEILNKVKSFDFDKYLETVGSEKFDSLVISQFNFFKNLNGVFAKVSLEQWKTYLSWCTIRHYSSHLNEKLERLDFAFYGTQLSGRSEMKPINERAINEITHSRFSELLGKMFVARHFSETAKQKVNTMVDNLTVVYKKRIEELTWMSKDTKQKALEKLASIDRKLGFPDKTDDYSTLSITADDYIMNIKNVARFAHIENMKKLNKPVDKSRWEMPAHMVNAYYHPLLNEIVFPAGIMQEPFFSEDYEDAMNYGAIGMVIGHEFTHGFDDTGSQFAADGSFTNWWTAADRTSFEERTGKLGATFSNFCPIDGHCVNPNLTMGENIADLGGLTMAYYAYKMTDEYKANQIINGFTPAQRFFISYAQLWKINYTDAELKNRLSNDTHSPGMYRVNGPLMNCPEFFEAFNVQPGDAMRNSDEKISRIW